MPMTQYTTWSRANFKDVIRREVMDTNTKWVSDSELNLWLDNWLNDLQQEFEFVWAINTITITLSTLTSTNTNSIILWSLNTSTFTPGMQRLEAIYYSGYRVAGRLLQNLEVGDALWRMYTPDFPRAAIQYPDSQGIVLWPTLTQSATQTTLVFEYPCLLSFAADTSTLQMPVWTQWSAKPYVCAKIYQRPGPINDPKKAMRYWAQYQRARLRIRRMWDGFLPERYRQLKPAGPYEWRIETPPPAWDAGTNTATGT
jgi:hypothetical protein